MAPWLQFVLLTYALSTPFYFALRRLESGEGRAAALERAVRQLMWVPGIAALILLAISGAGFGSLPLGPGTSPWLLLAALLLPVGMELLLILLVRLLGLGRVDRSIIQARDGWIYVNESVRLVLGHEKQAPLKFIVNLLLTIVIAVAFGLLFSLAEEIGWRGFLQDRLIERFTVTWGTVLGGIFWGIAYIPAVLKGYRFPEYPRLGAYVFMPVFTIAAGIVTGWMFWLSGSLWVAAILNASIRVSWTLSEAALGEAGGSGRVRIVWLWLWAALAGLVLTFWFAAV